MNTRRGATLAAVAALVFAAWEIVDHALLMDMEMVTYHLTGFLVETSLAVTAILWIAFTAERAATERERAEALAVIVAQALGSDDSGISPLTSLLEGVEDAERSAATTPEVREQLQSIRRDARRIQAVNRGLKRLLWPPIDAAAR